MKSSGDKGGAARIQALARPSVPAWAVNQAYRAARQEFDQLLASTRRLQTAQAEGVAGAVLREAMTARREALSAVAGRAESLLVGAGHGKAPGTLRRVLSTLEALAAAGVVSTAARPGRLVQDLGAPGFEALTGLLDAPSPGPGAHPGSATFAPPEAAGPLEAGRPRAAEPVDEPGAAALERARAAWAEAEKRLEVAGREARGAAGARAVAETRAEGARRELAEANLRFERARERAALADDDAAAAVQEAERTAAGRDVAEAARDAALRAMRELE